MDIDTPALIVDLEKMEKNLKILPQIMESFPNIAVRPHAKAHKSPELAKLQVHDCISAAQWNLHLLMPPELWFHMVIAVVC